MQHKTFRSLTLLVVGVMLGQLSPATAQVTPPAREATAAQATAGTAGNVYISPRRLAGNDVVLGDTTFSGDDIFGVNGLNITASATTNKNLSLKSSGTGNIVFMYGSTTFGTMSGTTGVFTYNGTINASGLQIGGTPVSTSSDTFWVSDTGGIKYTAGPVSLNGTPSGDAGDLQAEDLTLTGNLFNFSGATAAITMSGAGTGQKYIRMNSTGGDLYLGVESSVGGTFFTSAGNYESVFYSPNNNSYFRTPKARFSGYLDLDTNTSFSALSATGLRAHAQTAWGAVLGGYGTTNDVSLFNRAGGLALSVPANSTNVSVAGNLFVNGGSIFGSGSAGSGALATVQVNSNGITNITRTNLNGAGLAGVLQVGTEAKTIGDGFQISFIGKDSANNEQQYSAISSSILDPTSTSEDGDLIIRTTTAGSMTTAATFTGPNTKLAGNLNVGSAATATNIAIQLGGTPTLTSALAFKSGTVIGHNITGAVGDEVYGQLLNYTSTGTNVTFTVAGSGTHAAMHGAVVGAPAISGTGATVTNAATLYVPNAPAGGTVTNRYALLVAAGAVRFGGDLTVAGTGASSVGGTFSTGSHIYAAQNGAEIHAGYNNNVGYFIGGATTAYLQNRGASTYAQLTPTAMTLSGLNLSVTGTGASIFHGTMRFDNATPYLYPSTSNKQLTIYGSSNENVGLTLFGDTHATTPSLAEFIGSTAVKVGGNLTSLGATTTIGNSSSSGNKLVIERPASGANIIDFDGASPATNRIQYVRSGSFNMEIDAGTNLDLVIDSNNNQSNAQLRVLSNGQAETGTVVFTVGETGDTAVAGNITASSTGNHVFGTTNTITIAGGNITAAGSSNLAPTGVVISTSGALSSVAPGTSGNVLTSNGTTWTSVAPMTATFAEIYVADGTTAQSIPTGAGYTKLTAYTTDGVSNNCTAAAASDKITITTAGYYRVNYSISFSGDTNNVFWHFAPFLNGVEQAKGEIHLKTGTGSDQVSGSGTLLLNVTSVPWDLDLRGRHESAGSVLITPSHSNLNVTKIN